MKARVVCLVMLGVFFTVGDLCAQSPASVNAEASSASAGLADLVSNSKWSWWEGTFDRYKKGKMEYRVEFYKDGTARVPWRDHAQYWKLTGPNELTLSGAGLNPDKHVFLIDPVK